jgi:hypothetical protein
MQWALGCAMVYLSLFGVGNVVFGNYVRGGILIILSLAAGAGILAGLSRTRDEDLWRQDSATSSAD